MPYVSAKDGAKLHFSVHDYTDPWKNAPTLFMQHGLGRYSIFWYALIPYLSRYYKVVTPDLRGIGGSEQNFDLNTGLSVANYLSDILTIADSLGLENFHYAGESLGGILGLTLAAEHPDRLRTLSLLSVPLGVSAQTQKTFAFGHPTWQDALRTMGSKGWAAAVNVATRFPEGTDPNLLEWYAEECGKCDVEVLIAMSKVAAKLDLMSVLPRVKLPVLGLYPAEAKITTVEEEAILRRDLTNFRMIRLPSKYHMIWAQAPASCAEYILHFISAQDGRNCREL